ncbi:MAG: nitroreductase family protein [Verrucomicrobia bacterium]|nr:nitroreductase family protein [Verrucomicrobiota bacterium]MCH8510748.1 nitroreductase family protein [Kiritimatiellia bacterium]
MTVLEAIESRRAAKAFDPNHMLPEAHLREILRAGALAPTAFNIQHNRLLVVKNPEIRRKLRAVSWDQPQVTDASALIVVCADVQAWRKNPARYWRNAPEKVQDTLVDAIKAFYTDRDQAQRDEALRSSGMAAMNLMLAAKSLGYDSCPMDGFDFEAVAKIIHLPDDHLISMFVAIGRNTVPPKARSGFLEDHERFFEDGFPVSGGSQASIAICVSPSV